MSKYYCDKCNKPVPATFPTEFGFNTFCLDCCAKAGYDIVEVTR